MGEKGWRFVESEDELEGSTPDTLYHAKFLREIYFRSQPDYEGRFTVPVLWDKKTETIVNNESRLLFHGTCVDGIVRLFECFILNLILFCLRTREV